MRAVRTSVAGFTLAETLVALLILAAVSAAGTSLLMGATSTSKQVRETEADIRQLDIAQALIRGDIAALSVRGVKPESGIGEAGNLFGQSSSDERPFLSFVRSGWQNPGTLEARSSLQHVSYHLEDGDLIRTVTVRPDATPSTPVAERVLFRDVENIEMSFERGGVRSPEWIGDAGQPLHVLPDLIEMEIVFEDERTFTMAILTGARS